MSTVTPRRPASSRPAPVRAGGHARSVASAKTIDPFRVVRRHMLLIWASVFIGGGIGVGAFFVLRKYYPLYQATVIFEVQPGIADANDISTNRRLKDEDVARIGNTQLVLLGSRQVLEAAVKTNDVKRTKWFQTNYLDATGERIQDAVDELEDSIKTGVVRGTELFSVSWATHDKEDVPVVLNKLAEAYMDSRKAIDEVVYVENLKQFQRQLDETNRIIDDLDQEIEQHIIESGITSLDDPRYSQSALAIQEITVDIGETQRQVSVGTTLYKQDQAKLEGILEYSPEDVLHAENDYSVAQSIRQVETMKVELRVLQNDYPSDDHPLVRKTESRLRAAEGVYRDKLDEVIRRNLTARIKTTADQIEQASRSLEQLQIELEKRGDELRSLASQQSRFDSMRKRREFLEGSREGDQQLIKEIRLLRLRDDSTLAKILDRAETPREIYFPKLIIIVPLFVLLTTGATIGIVFLRELTDQRVKGASDLSVVPGTDVVGVIPDLDEDPTRAKSAELVVQRFPKSIVAETYRQTATVMLKTLEFAGHNTVVLMSGLPGSGTTTAAANIVASMSAAGRRVLLVDANFRRPGVAKTFDLESDSPGLGDLLSGAASLDDAIQQTEHGCDVVTAGTPAERVVERLSSERLGSVIAEMRDRYDIVLFDAPPAVVAGDAMSIAHRVDAAALIVMANQEQRGLVARLVAQVERTGANMLGIVLNRPRGTAGGYFKKNYAAMAEYAGKSAAE